MKTEQELKDALEDIFFEALTDMSNYTSKVDPEKDGYWQCKVYELCADAVIQHGYGDISEYKTEIEQLNKKLAKQIRIARDANAGCWGAKRNAYHLQCKAGRLELKNAELETNNKYQVREIMKYKAEIEKLKEKCAQQDSEIDKLEQVIKDNDERCFDCPEVKQAKIDMLNKVKSLAIYDDNYLDGYIFVDDIDELINEVENNEN